jgi:7-carboxy-7-deazaguanine synthase
MAGALLWASRLSPRMMSRVIALTGFTGVVMSSGLFRQVRANGSFQVAPSSLDGALPEVLPPSRHHHRLAPLEKKPAGCLVIHEIYRSLQGESTFAGLPCVFIRLTACHLRCVYCDTPHAFAEGQIFDLDAVLAQALALGDDLVEITGGEPLLQPEVYPLMTRLADSGKTVLLETSGAIDVSAVDPRVHIILDIKTPGSAEVDANVWSNLDRLKPFDEVKVVVCNRADFDWAADIIRARALTERCPVLFSAAFGEVDPAELARWILESHLPVRLQLQQHKILWEPNARGV